MSYLGQSFWSIVDALKHGEWSRYKFVTNGNVIVGQQPATYFDPLGGNCLCAIGVMFAVDPAASQKSDQLAIKLLMRNHCTISEDARNNRYFALNSTTKIPMSILRAAEDLFEGWYWSKIPFRDQRSAYHKWSHHEIGIWLEKVGRAIETREARRCEFELKNTNQESQLKELADTLCNLS
jgi:hypothetical protein